MADARMTASSAEAASAHAASGKPYASSNLNASVSRTKTPRGASCTTSTAAPRSTGNTRTSVRGRRTHSAYRVIAANARTASSGKP